MARIATSGRTNRINELVDHRGAKHHAECGARLAKSLSLLDCAAIF